MSEITGNYSSAAAVEVSVEIDAKQSEKIAHYRESRKTYDAAMSLLKNGQWEDASKKIETIEDYRTKQAGWGELTRHLAKHRIFSEIDAFFSKITISWIKEIVRVEIGCAYTCHHSKEKAYKWLNKQDFSSPTEREMTYKYVAKELTDLDKPSDARWFIEKISSEFVFKHPSAPGVGRLVQKEAIYYFMLKSNFYLETSGNQA